MFLKNLVSILIPAVLSLLASSLLNAYTTISSANTLYGLLFFCGICFILNLFYALNARSKALTELLFAGIVIKLLLALSVIVIYSVMNYAGLFSFSLHFMLYYILFTVFEIRYLSGLIKANQTKTNS